MNDLSDLVPLIAAKIGLAPTTLLLILWLVHKAAFVISKKIPDDATGWRGTLRSIAGFVGTDVQSVIATSPSGAAVTIADVAKAALSTPPIPAKVEAETKES